MLDSRRASCQIFDCFFCVCGLFFLSKSKLHILLLLCFHMLGAKSRRKNKNKKVGCSIYCQQGWFGLLFNQKELSALETSHYLM